LIAEEPAEITSPAVLLTFPSLTDPAGGQRPAHGNSSSTIMKSMKLNVECYSGRKADERPLRFWLGGRQYQVETVLDQWYDPESVFYKIRALRTRPRSGALSTTESLITGA